MTSRREMPFGGGVAVGNSGAVMAAEASWREVVRAVRVSVSSGGVEGVIVVGGGGGEVWRLVSGRTFFGASGLAGGGYPVCGVIR